MAPLAEVCAAAGRTGSGIRQLLPYCHSRCTGERLVDDYSPIPSRRRRADGSPVFPHSQGETKAPVRPALRLGMQLQSAGALRSFCRHTLRHFTRGRGLPGQPYASWSYQLSASVRDERRPAFHVFPDYTGSSARTPPCPWNGGST